MSFRLLHPDSFNAWKNEDILRRFSKYKGIIDGTHVARYLLAKSLECEFNSNDSLEKLKNLLKKKKIEFNELLKENTEVLKKREVKANSYVNLAEHIAYKYLTNCSFCERKCGINRIQNEKGFCFLTKDSYISSTFLHMGEESVLVPSGTIFFQGCNFGCLFCQNYDISQSWKGKRAIEDIAQKIDDRGLARLAKMLVEKGALNINYVGGDPIPNLHTIIGSLKYQESNICQLWNSNFYLTNESLLLIVDLIDFWLPDFKFSSKCAKTYSNVDNYFEVITRNLKRIHDEGSGEIIIRHLVMPNHIECCSKPILDYIAKEVPKCVVNIMGQYRPQYKAHDYEEINRRPTSEEIQEVKNHADQLGILYKPVS